jgi:hypothetical protein
VGLRSGDCRSRWLSQEDPPMTKIKFSNVRIFDPAQNRNALEGRFTAFLRELRQKNLPVDEPVEKLDDGAEEQQADWLEMNPERRDVLTTRDYNRIHARAERIIALRKAASSTSHLKREDVDRLQVLREPLQLIRIPNEHRADEIAAQLHAEMPWMAPATDVFWKAMRQSVHEGWPGFRLPPILLVGPAGIGKSHWARLIGDLISVPTAVIEATTECASFGIVGSQRSWGSAASGRVLDTILETKVVNPIIVIDEVEKAGTATSTRGVSFSLTASLLPLLEPLSAKGWSCPYFQIQFDMSWIGWVLTANDHRHLPQPLLSRCPPTKLQHLTQRELATFIRAQGLKRGLSEIAVETTVEAVTDPRYVGQEVSLRLAARLLQRAAMLECAPRLH